MAKRNNVERQLTAARKRAHGADSVFESLAQEYEAAAVAADEAHKEAYAVVSEYRELAREAHAHAEEATNKATKIREFFGSTK